MLELFFPLFSLADAALARVVPASVRVLLLSAFVSGLSILIYVRLSPQQQLAAMKRLGARLNCRLLTSGDSTFQEMLDLSIKSMALNLARLGRTLPPVLVAAVPMVALLLWTWRACDRQWPPPGTPVEFVVTPADALVGPAERVVPLGGGAFRIQSLPPSADVATLALVDAACVRLLVLPSRDGAFAWSRRTGATRILGSPERALPRETVVERIEFRLPPRELLPAGPRWMRGWPVPFFFAAVVIPLLLKKILGIL